MAAKNVADLSTCVFSGVGMDTQEASANFLTRAPPRRA